MKKLPVAALLFISLVFTSCQHNSPTVTLAFLGDLMIGRAVDPKPYSLSILKPYISRSDLVLANLESPLGIHPPGLDPALNLCASSTQAGLLADWGFNLLTINNNHMYDCSVQGPANTRSILERVGITPIGPGPEPVYHVVNGLPLVFLAFDDTTSPLDDITVVKEIQNQRAGGSLVIVSIHWGMEYQGGPTDRQISLAREFIIAGAQLVWGHHPHVIQPAEFIDSSHGPALILYSLGNCLFDQGGLSNTRESALVMVSFRAGGVTKVDSVPFVIDTVNSQLLIPNAEIANKIRDNLNIP
jgi:poly-gamma-glutamate synthesis protein (capsule biosynthesis protein)